MTGNDLRDPSDRNINRAGASRRSDRDPVDLTGEPIASMRLRPEPPRVTRLSRKVLVGLGMIASFGIGSALIYGLQLQYGRGGNGELYETDHRNTPDGLNGLPKDYTGPVLGPPLPGDLGRPIVEAQKRDQPVMPPAVDPDIQRRIAEAEAARLSQVFFQSSTHPADLGMSAPGQIPLADISSGDGVGMTAAARQRAFLNQTVDRRTVSADRLMPSASPFILQAGSVIPAALISGMRSDLPGQVVAQVTQNVYDSPTGRLLLIPQGSRVLGDYSNDVGFGQRRVLLVWNRLIYPNGRSIVLERQPGADTQGYAGLEDGVDYHWWDLAKAAGLSTLLGIGAELATDDNERLVRAIRDGAQDTINHAGEQIVQRQLQIAPTLTIRPGFPVRIMVTRDLILDSRGAHP